MEYKVRFCISFGVVLFCFIAKYLSLNVIAVEQTRRLCYLIFGRAPESFDFMRMFRALGWDCANASAGLFTLASVYGTSNFRQMCIKAGMFDMLLAFLCFLIFLIFYIIAVKIRYVLLETAEEIGIRRWMTGLVGWATGIIMLFHSSWLVVGAK
jgi:hypothetical protein